ncbi:hypothetical protein EJ04DRAFT_557549 [Polyplosphaeria fusca]|uniref:Uncharacterized protein n=1 Tax=Polyplosphaeria fusca TaxID=682080 RepID=A0A9P4QH41_9PLEO|nr:hypothetical protein EJ04DRAFT_557549 [Polyplosphaeria fusca]
MSTPVPFASALTLNLEQLSNIFADFHENAVAQQEQNAMERTLHEFVNNEFRKANLAKRADPDYDVNVHMENLAEQFVAVQKAKAANAEAEGKSYDSQSMINEFSEQLLERALESKHFPEDSPRTLDTLHKVLSHYRTLEEDEVDTDTGDAKEWAVVKRGDSSTSESETSDDDSSSEYEKRAVVKRDSNNVAQSRHKRLSTVAAQKEAIRSYGWFIIFAYMEYEKLNGVGIHALDPEVLRSVSNNFVYLRELGPGRRPFGLAPLVVKYSRQLAGSGLRQLIWEDKFLPFLIDPNDDWKVWVAVTKDSKPNLPRFIPSKYGYQTSTIAYTPPAVVATADASSVGSPSMETLTLTTTMTPLWLGGKTILTEDSTKSVPTTNLFEKPWTWATSSSISGAISPSFDNSTTATAQGGNYTASITAPPPTFMTKPSLLERAIGFKPKPLPTLLLTGQTFYEGVRYPYTVTSAGTVFVVCPPKPTPTDVSETSVLDQADLTMQPSATPIATRNKPSRPQHPAHPPHPAQTSRPGPWDHPTPWDTTFGTEGDDGWSRNDGQSQYNRKIEEGEQNQIGEDGQMYTRWKNTDEQWRNRWDTEMYWDRWGVKEVDSKAKGKEDADWDRSWNEGWSETWK